MAFYSYLSTKIIIAFITKSYQDLFGVRSYINAKINLSGKSGYFVICQGISRIIGILRPFLWRTSGCCHLGNRKQVPCILTCNSSLQYPAF